MGDAGILVAVNVGSAFVIFAALFGFWWKLDGKIEDVRKASESAHADIRSELSNAKDARSDAKAERTAMTAQLRCVEDKVDAIQRRLDKTG